MPARILVYVGLLLLIIISLALRTQRNPEEPPPDPAARRKLPSPAPTPIPAPTRTAARFVCDGGKTMDVTFYAAPSTPAPTPDQPPILGGRVHLVLSDGRTLHLPQTLSADGARYAQADGSLVFWNKGNGALVLENNRQKTYIGCIAVADDPGGLPRVYESGSAGFSIRYPADYTVDPGYTYQALGPGKDIFGVKFTIAASLAARTNLATDSYLSVEEIPRAASCTAMGFLPEGTGAPADVAENGTTYSVARSIGAGAGNRYEETVYALPGTNPCMAVRYFIHYGVLQNYPAGAVREFDKTALLVQFDAMRRTLVVQQ